VAPFFFYFFSHIFIYIYFLIFKENILIKMSTINQEKEFSIEKQFLSADLEDSLIIQEQTKIV